MFFSISHSVIRLPLHRKELWNHSLINYNFKTIPLLQHTCYRVSAYFPLSEMPGMWHLNVIYLSASTDFYFWVRAITMFGTAIQVLNYPFGLIFHIARKECAQRGQLRTIV